MRLITLLSLLCLLVSPAWANELPPDPEMDFILTEIGGPGVVFSPTGEWTSFELVVVGPEGVAVAEIFDGTIAPEFSLFEPSGEPRCDGVYTWEIRAEPALTPEEIDALELARLEGEPRPVGIPMGGVDHGAFSIQAGEVLIGSEGDPLEGDDFDEGTFAARSIDPDVATRQVIQNDLIVWNSACVGFDCENPESFGFDTFRLKENNLRIHFDDTSTAGSYPKNDWRIRANDSSNGGESMIAIDDVTSGRTPFKVMAGAGNNALVVRAGGNVGLGTATPVADLHVR
ncbi:MAG: hypothetical protein AAGD38_24550, partial [Acidobacteriota bacterium]